MYYVLMHKYSNQTDIVIGTPVSNRHYGQLEGLVGFFVNSLALRQKVDVQSYRDFIQEVHEMVLESQYNQDLPFERLVEELTVERDTSRHPIFQVIFGLQNFGKSQSDYFKSVDIGGYDISKYDLSLFISDSLQIRGSIEYSTSLYTKDSILRLVEHYKTILESLVNDLDRSIAGVSLLTEEDYQTIVYDWNNTDKDYPKDKTIYELFQEQVDKNPDNVALVYEDKALTYKQLDERSNQLARYLRSNYDIKPDTLITLCLDRSLEMVIGILGVMKSGGAYVPIDPNYPKERINYILEDTQSGVLITQSHLLDRL